MQSATYILVYGRDMALLDTRRLVLESAGFTTKTAGTQSGLAQELAVGQVVLCILCHTLSPEERRSMLEIIHYARPESKVLVLQANKNGYDLTSTDPVVSIFDGPAKLVATVQDIMRPIKARLLSVSSS